MERVPVTAFDNNYLLRMCAKNYLKGRCRSAIVAVFYTHRSQSDIRSVTNC